MSDRELKLAQVLEMAVRLLATKQEELEELSDNLPGYRKDDFKAASRATVDFIKARAAELGVRPRLDA